MYIPKRYGESKIETCPFCGKRATAATKEGLSVCNEHVNEKLPEIKCVCGSYLEMKKGKFGPFFVCINCGTINLKKALDMMNNMQAGKPNGAEKVKVNALKGKDPEVADSGKYKDFDYGIY